MKPENKAWIEAHKHIYDFYIANEVLVGGFDFNKALQIIREEYEPKAMFCTWCKEDMINMLKYLYTQYGK